MLCSLGCIQLGDIFKEKLIPNAVLWFTGEALEYESDADDEDEMGAHFGGLGQEDGEDDDEDDPDYEPPAAGEKPAECKQQ